MNTDQKKAVHFKAGWLLLLLTIHNSFAAGLDFTASFWGWASWDNIVVTNRFFNTHTGPADGRRFYTSDRAVRGAGTPADTYLSLDMTGYLTRINSVTDEYSIETQKFTNYTVGRGLAYDPLTNRMVFAAYSQTDGGSESALYEIRNSGIYKLANIADYIDSLVYFPPQNAFWALRRYTNAPAGPAAFIHYDAAGRKIGEVAVPGFPVNVGVNHQRSELFAVGDRIVMTIDSVYPYLEPEDKLRIYIFDPATGSIEKTFEAAQSLPVVRFKDPATTVITQGMSLDISMEVSDPENDLRTADIRINQDLKEQWTISPGTTGTNVFTYHWTPDRSGTFSFSAYATDAKTNGAWGGGPQIQVRPAGFLTMTSPLNIEVTSGGTDQLLEVHASGGNFTLLTFYTNNVIFRELTNFSMTATSQVFRAVLTNPPGGSVFAFKAVGVTDLGGKVTNSGRIITFTNTTEFFSHRTLPPAYTPNQPFDVTIQVNPPPWAVKWYLNEYIPTGSFLSSTGPSEVGNDDVRRFGPFTNSAPRTISYRLYPPLNGKAVIHFFGVLEIRGVSNSYYGEKVSGGEDMHPPKTISRWTAEGKVALSFHATPNERFVIECADTPESLLWEGLATIEGSETPVQLPDIDPSAAKKFYRMRPVPPVQ